MGGMYPFVGIQIPIISTWCLNPDEVLSPGQQEEIDRVKAAYPHLADDDFVREQLDEWLAE